MTNLASTPTETAELSPYLDMREKVQAAKHQELEQLAMIIQEQQREIVSRTI